MPGFDLLAFSEAALYDGLANDFAPSSSIAIARQAQYLFGYLNDLKATTIIIEREYIDGDYLEDYSSYYVSCFDRYGNRCKRLHFFSCDFDVAGFERFIEGENSIAETMQNGYLGFIVARPLPEAVIGRTLLRTYPKTKTVREYPTTRTYEVSLFGRCLKVETLPYQQQDTVLAACATVSLWSAFHKTNELFNTPNPRPARITRAANAVRGVGRALPSRDLNLGQMCEAVRNVGLEPQIEQITPTTPLLSIMYGHLRYGIPPILGVSFELQGKWVGHAITVTGYSMADHYHPLVAEQPIGDVYSLASRIEKIFVHDDNVGPFARLRLERPPGVRPPNFPENYPWPPFLFRGYGQGQVPETQFFPLFVLLPVYGKIRVTFSEMHSWPQRLMRLLGSYRFPSYALEWDIHLTNTQAYKNEARETMMSLPGVRDMLYESQPRFIWRAIAMQNKVPLFEILGDATGLGRSCPIFEVIWHEPNFKRLIQVFLRSLDRAALERTLTKRFAGLLLA